MSGSALKPTNKRDNPSLADTLNDGWARYGSSGVAVYVSGTSFKITGRDVTADFTAGRKLRIYHATSAAYKYVTVASSAFSTDTTVTVVGNTLLNEVYSSIWMDLSPVGYSQDQIAGATPTAGDLIYVDANGRFARLPVGNAGEHLIADSSGYPNYIPDGRAGMINGKITTSVASNNLTVAIKTLAGTDPSTTDPVYVRIGNTIRAITAALSVTKNAGTNWFDAGTETAAQEIDYFVYLIWNTTPATDIVDIGFSRIAHGRLYSDFSGTTTNDRYLAFANASTPTSTDECQNVGRFNATLSAGAGYTWSIPATSIIIQHPIFSTRVLGWVPVLESGATDFNFATKTGYYHIAFDKCYFSFSFSSTVTVGSASAAFISTPLAALAGVTQLPTGVAIWIDADYTAGLRNRPLVTQINSGDESNLRPALDGSSFLGSFVAAGDQMYMNGSFNI